MIIFPTKHDIYLDQDGEKVAVVQSYISANVCGVYEIRLFKVYMIDVKRPLLSLNNFSLVAERQGKMIVYTGCKWKIREGLDGMTCETAYITAENRLEAQNENNEERQIEF